ncbi:MAG: barstar family protein [Nocardiaceae bacterium]|nr:barstar family protein [Nocardiaceae bacterium]
MKTYVLYGKKIDSKAELFTELGRAVNGPGGYFGSNLDALADCLRGGFGTPRDEPFRFVLMDFHHVQKALAEQTWDGLLEVFRHSGVELVLGESVH